MTNEQLQIRLQQLTNIQLRKLMVIAHMHWSLRTVLPYEHLDEFFTEDGGQLQPNVGPLVEAELQRRGVPE